MVRGASDFVACIIAAWLGSFMLPAQACDLSPPETGTVAAVLDGETLRLTDGKTVSLIGAKARCRRSVGAVMIPGLWSMRPGQRYRPLPPAGRWSSDLPGGTSTGTVISSPKFMWWRVKAASGSSRSLSPARVYSFTDNRACVAELLAREREARAKRLGVWGSPAYRIESALDVKQLGRSIPTSSSKGRSWRWARAPADSISISRQIGAAISPSASRTRT